MKTEDEAIGERENCAAIASASDELGGETVGEAAGDEDEARRRRSSRSGIAGGAPDAVGTEPCTIVHEKRCAKTRHAARTYRLTALDCCIATPRVLVVFRIVVVIVLAEIENLTEKAARGQRDDTHSIAIRVMIQNELHWSGCSGITVPFPVQGRTCGISVIVVVFLMHVMLMER